MTGQTDKIMHGYEPDYRDLAGRVGPYGTLVEIGIGDGAGLDFFREVGLCADWVGVDNDSARCAAVAVLGYQTLLADQADDDLPGRIAGLCSPSVIVDDASHDYDLTACTLYNIWPVLQPGGYYVIEDWSHINSGTTSLFRSLFRGVIGDAEIRRATITSDGLIIFQKYM